MPVVDLLDLLGNALTLPIRRFGPPGAFLAADPKDERPDAPVVLLPGGEIPEGAREGDKLDVFIYLDSSARPIATLRKPKLEMGEIAFLTVTDTGPFGAFVDWGMPKDLLVPFAEQTRPLAKGERHAFALYIDDTKRLAATMRVSERLEAGGAEFAPDEWVEAEAFRNDPDVGLFLIVERTYLGMVPKTEPHALTRGQATRARVVRVHPDGKMELSLRGRAHEAMEGDAERVLEKLVALAREGKHASEDRDPEAIREDFGLSKKAFKRAVGTLYRARKILIAEDGTLEPLPESDAATTASARPASTRPASTRPASTRPRAGTPRRAGRG